MEKRVSTVSSLGRICGHTNIKGNEMSTLCCVSPMVTMASLIHIHTRPMNGQVQGCWTNCLLIRLCLPTFIYICLFICLCCILLGGRGLPVLMPKPTAGIPVLQFGVVFQRLRMCWSKFTYTSGWALLLPGMELLSLPRPEICKNSGWRTRKKAQGMLLAFHERF